MVLSGFRGFRGFWCGSGPEGIIYGSIVGSIVGIINGNTRSLDDGSYGRLV